MGVDGDKLTLHIGDKPAVENYEFVEESCAFQFKDIPVPQKSGILTLVIFSCFSLGSNTVKLYYSSEFAQKTFSIPITIIPGI